MLTVAKTLWSDDTGVVISAELVLVLTITTSACLVGLNEVGTGVIHELADISNSFGALDQSWQYLGMISRDPTSSKVKSRTTGGLFQDQQDECDSCSGSVNLVDSQVSIGHGETAANNGNIAGL
ncbi:MAG: hypothetical protein ABGZ17_30995 [Planctomycetaceae bacterium]